MAQDGDDDETTAADLYAARHLRQATSALGEHNRFAALREAELAVDSLKQRVLESIADRLPDVPASWTAVATGRRDPFVREQREQRSVLRITFSYTIADENGPFDFVLTLSEWQARPGDGAIPTVEALRDDLRRDVDEATTAKHGDTTYALGRRSYGPTDATTFLLASVARLDIEIVTSASASVASVDEWLDAFDVIALERWLTARLRDEGYWE